MSQDSNNLPKGLNITTQIPLDVKTYIDSEDTLSHLGDSNQLAFTYPDGIKIYSVLEKTVWQWRQVPNGLEDTGLLFNGDFTYPSGVNTFGIDYSNKKYNFFKVEYVNKTDEKIYNAQSVGDQNDIYKGKSVEENSTTFYIKTIKVENTGTGEEILKNIEPSNDYINIDAKKISSQNDTLLITSDDDNIFIDLPNDNNIKQFYVNETYTGDDPNGSILKPFKKITDALVAAIGEGTIANPQFENANVILQTNCTINPLDLTNAAILENKISVNTITIRSDKDDIKIINYRGSVNYPIDTEFLVTKVGVDVNLDLNRNVYLAFNNIEIYSDTVKGLIKSRSYNRGVIDITKPQTYLEFLNGNINCGYKPAGIYVNAKDNLNANLFLFGQQVLVQDSIVNDTPHIYAYGLGHNGEGNLNLDYCTITGSSQTHFKLLNTSFSANELTIRTNSFLMNSVDATPSTNGNYLPKTDIYKFDIENSYCRILNFKEFAAYPQDSVYGYIGGCNSLFRCTRTNLSSKYNSLTIDNGFIYGTKDNYLLELDTNCDNIAFNNCKFNNYILKQECFNTIGSIVGTKYISAENSELNFVENATPVKIYAVNASINNAMYSSVVSYPDNNAALAGGLIPNNFYINTSTKVLTRVI